MVTVDVTEHLVMLVGEVCLVSRDSLDFLETEDPMTLEPKVIVWSENLY